MRLHKLARQAFKSGPYSLPQEKTEPDPELKHLKVL